MNNFLGLQFEFMGDLEDGAYYYPDIFPIAVNISEELHLKQREEPINLDNGRSLFWLYKNCFYQLLNQWDLNEKHPDEHARVSLRNKHHVDISGDRNKPTLRRVNPCLRGIN